MWCPKLTVIADEIANLKKEAAAFREVRQNLGEEDGPRRVFDKVSRVSRSNCSSLTQLTRDQVFKADIERLLAMDDLWNKPGRVKPKALDYDTIMDGTFVPPLSRVNASSASTTSTAAPANGEPAGQNTASGSVSANSTKDAAGVNSNQLRDQRELSLKENLELFIDR